MGWTIHKKKRAVDAEKHLYRLHKNTPLIESPLEGADHDSLVFSQRHEANTVELFFDLFFVANLATFTTYHSITDKSYLIAYVGFFGILWSTWFNVTLHDVRFARDSLYERFCKTIQFITFVGLALVGSGFNPSSSKAKNTNFRVLCYTLIISRSLLAIQYAVVLYYIVRAKFSKLYLPLGLMVALYAVMVGIFGAMTPAFAENHKSRPGIYMVWYVAMIIESIAVIGISSIWRMLSFKKTHLMERMSLLTLIVIGEGAIGVTKTVSRIMGKYGLEVEGCFLVMCIIAVLVITWALYFDNFPHGHYGTIRQQIWSLLHFPFQLAIVGVVEGSQQVALARYVLKNWAKIDKMQYQYCITEHLNGPALRDALLKLVDYWDFKSKYETYNYYKYTTDTVYKIGNMTNVCSKENTTTYLDSGMWPAEFMNMTQQMFDGVYMGLGMKLPVSRLEHESAEDIAVNSWKIVFIYYWASFCLLIACSLIFLLLIRRHRHDIFDYVSISSRVIVLVIGGSIISLIANQKALFEFIQSPAVLPTCLSLLVLVILTDKISSEYANYRLKKSGLPYALEYDDDHHHNNHHHQPDSLEEVGGLVISHKMGHKSHDSLSSRRISAAWSYNGDNVPLAQDAGSTGGTAYERVRGEVDDGYLMQPVMSPPLLSPPLLSPPAAEHRGGQRGSYAPVRYYSDGA